MKKRKIVGIVQSNFVPWQGYFDFIKSCDEFILFDDVQYTERDWRNRNRLRTDQGFKWINVPVIFSRSTPTIIDETLINHSVEWIKPIEDLIKHCYKRSPNFDLYYSAFIQILKKKHRTISNLNEELIRWVCREMEIYTPITQARTYCGTGAKTDRLLDLLKKSKATIYISGPAARDYIQIEKFKTEDIELRYKSYSYPPYSQLQGEFIPGLSILDLLFNEGSRAKCFIESQVPDEIIQFI